MSCDGFPKQTGEFLDEGRLETLSFPPPRFERARATAVICW
jgi:hypothetical protein